MRCWQGASLALLPAGLAERAHSLSAQGPLSPLSPTVEFHLHPHYRTKRPLDATLLKVRAGSDEFFTEKINEQIEAILAQWTAGLIQRPAQLQAVERVLAANFSGSSCRPMESRVVRPGPVVEVRKIRYAHEASLDADAFMKELRSALDRFSFIVTAEFQVTSIEAGAAPVSREPVRTSVRYDLVGSGPDFHREQWVGSWHLEWESNPAGEFRLRTWQFLEETRSRASGQVFVDVTAQALGANPSYSAQLLHGADHWRTVLDGACGIDIYGHNGICVADIDGDGFDDLYVCQPAGLPNRLYRNRGDGTFEDITEASGVGMLDNTACALSADFDNDGHQDLIVVCANGPVLFLNEGGGRFRKKAEAFRFANPPQGTFTGAAVADYDRDGWLDVYFCLYSYYQGTDQYRYPAPYYDAENGPPNFLMRNNRDGTFRDVTAESGLNRNNTRYSFCCGWGDFNRDGWPDLYVVNDFGRKNLYRNNGDGTFTDTAPQAGVEDVGAGMSVCVFDYDNDGADDLYVANMWTAAGERVTMQPAFQKEAQENSRALYRKHAMGNSLFHNKGNGVFDDASTFSGSGMGRWSWSSDAWDFDHDGFSDLYIANGMVSGPSRDDLNSFFWRQVVARSPNDARPSHGYEQGWNAINELIRADGTWSGYERNIFYANNRDGTFADVSGVAGLDFLEDARSFALADLDHDGRLELILKNRNGPQVRILRNVVKTLAPAISFRLRGQKGNRDAIGAVVTIESGARPQSRTLQAGSGFLSQHSKDMFFGLGSVTGPVRASIRWPNGTVQELHDLPVNHRIWLEEGSAPSRMEPFKAGLPVPPEGAPVGSQEAERLPVAVETWLLAPVVAPEISLPDSNGTTHSLAALRGKPALLCFWAANSEETTSELAKLERVHRVWARKGLQLITIGIDDREAAGGVQAVARDLRLSFPVLPGTDDVAAVYNILFRGLFDRHRDMILPTSCLIDEEGEIVKVYQGALNLEHLARDSQDIPRTVAARMAKGLPFPGVTDNTEFGRNYLSWGSVFFQRRYLEQAEASFQTALRDNPSSAEALYGLGSVYLQQQKNSEARLSFERAVQLSSGYPDTLPNAWNNLGLLATREGRIEEAIQYFQEALRLSPDHLVALENLGNAYRQEKRWDDARQTLERAVAVGPDDAEANYSLGMVFAQTGDNDQAFKHLQKALQARSDYPEALNNLGILYLRTGKQDAAEESFKECIRVAPAFDQSYINLARVYATDGKADEARAILLDLLKQHPGHAQAEKALAELPR